MKENAIKYLQGLLYGKNECDRELLSYIIECVKESKKDPNSIFCYYQKLIKIRKEEALVKDGIYRDILPKSRSIFAYERKGDKQLLLVISNFTPKEVKCNLLKKYPDYHWEILLNNYPNVSDKLLPYQTILYKLTKSLAK